MNLPFRNSKKQSSGSTKFQTKKIKTVKEILDYFDSTFDKDEKGSYKFGDITFVEEHTDTMLFVIFFDTYSDNTSEFTLAYRLLQVTHYLNVIPILFSDVRGIAVKWPFIVYENTDIMSVMHNMRELSFYIMLNAKDMEVDFEDLINYISESIRGENN